MAVAPLKLLFCFSYPKTV